MPPSLRHLIAVFLLVLLPLQAMAAVYSTASAPLVSCSGALMASGCCDHDDDAGAACRASACFAIAAVAPPLCGTVCIATGAPSAAVPGVPRIYTSFIADGPQRPPCQFS